MVKKIAYQDAINEIEEILKALEDNTLSVDKLEENVKRVAILIRLCKDKLTTTEKQVEAILNDLKDED